MGLKQSFDQVYSLGIFFHSSPLPSSRSPIVFLFRPCLLHSSQHPPCASLHPPCSPLALCTLPDLSPSSCNLVVRGGAEGLLDPGSKGAPPENLFCTGATPSRITARCGFLFAGSEMPLACEVSLLGHFPISLASQDNTWIPLSLQQPLLGGPTLYL